MDTRKLRESLDRIREAEKQDYAWYDYGIDMGTGVFAGATDAAEETYQFTAWAADKLAEGVAKGTNYTLGSWMGFQLDEQGLDGRSYEEGSHFDRLMWEPPRPKTTAGKITEDISQFGFGLLGAGKLTGLTKVGKAAATGTKKQQFAKGMVDSAVSASVAHNPYEKRLSDAIDEIPMFEDSVLTYLKAEEDDSIALRRLKMAGEDLALGAVLTPLLIYARGAKRINKGEDPKKVEEDVNSEIAEATEAKRQTRLATNKKRQSATAAAKREQKRIDTAAEKGQDVSEMPRPKTTALMADEIEHMATTSGKTRVDALKAEKKVDLMQRAKLLGIKTNSRTTKTQLAEKIDQTVFPNGKKFVGAETVEVTAKATDGVGIQKPKRKKPTKAQVKKVADTIKNPRDIQEVFDETGANYKLFNRTQDGDVPLVNFADEMTSALQDTINDMKPVLDKIKGKYTVDDLKLGVAKDLADKTDLTPDEWVNRAFAYGKTIEEGMVVLHALESTMNESMKRIYKLASDRRYGSNEQIQTKFAAETEALMKMIEGAKGIETSFGRGLRMRQEGVFDINTLKEAVSDLGGEKSLEQFRAAVVASDGNLGTIGRATKTLGRGKIFKTTAMTGEFFRSMILFNIKTHVTNTMSGLTETVLVPMERYVGSYLTFGKNPFGAEAKAIRDDTVYHMMGIFATAKDSVQLAGKSLKLEKNFLDPANTKLDGNEVVNKISSEFTGIRPDSLLGKNLDTIGKISRGSLRALGAEDEFFKQINYRSRVFAEAYREAKVLFDAGKLSKDGMKAHALKKVDEAFDEAGRGTRMDAVQYSREITFTEELMDGSKALVLQKAVQQHPSLQLFLPFVRTPTNLIVRGVQRTPLAALLSRRYRDTLKHGTPEEVAQMKGRVALGSTFLLAAGAYAMEGKITGAGPADPAQNKLWRQAGNQPYSLKLPESMGGGWMSYNRFDPVMMPVGLMANFFDMSKHLAENDVEDIFATSVFAMSTTLQDKAYLQGLAGLFEILQTDDPTALKSIKSVRDNMIASFVPAAPLQVVEGVQRLTADPEENQPYPELSEAVGLVDKIYRRLPFMIEKLPKRHNWLTGEAIVNPDPFSTGFPVVPDKSTEFVGAELVALKYPFKGPSRRIEGIELSSDQLSDYHKFMGTTRVDGMTLMQALESVMKNPAYRTDESRIFDGEVRTREIQVITKVLSAYKTAARAELYRKYPDLMSEVNARKINNRAGTRLLETNR